MTGTGRWDPEFAERTRRLRAARRTRPRTRSVPIWPFLLALLATAVRAVAVVGAGWCAAGWMLAGFDDGGWLVWGLGWAALYGVGTAVMWWLFRREAHR